MKRVAHSFDGSSNRAQHRITRHIRYAPLVLALRDIAPYGRNVVYAGNVIRHRAGEFQGYALEGLFWINLGKEV